MVLKYTKKDWIYDFCKAVENVLNSDSETKDFLKFHIVDEPSTESETYAISAADLTPEILESTMDFINDERVCDINKFDKTFRDFTFFKVFDKEELLPFEERLEKMFYETTEEAQATFSCFDDLVNTNERFDDHYLSK